jgi:putative FmdB family regulatory protein
MPLLRFKCQVCGKKFAKIFFSVENAPKRCPVCAAPELEELGPAFRPDIRAIQRAVCISCDSCGDSPSVNLSGSS